MIKGQIKAAIFDAGGVLHETNLATENTFKSILHLDDDRVNSIWCNEINLLGKGEISESEFWQLCTQNYGIRTVLPEENLLGAAYAEQLSPHHDTLELVDRLGRAGLQLAVLSNTIEPHAQVLQKQGIYSHFNRLFLSHKLGLQKPDHRIYTHAFSELGVQADETIFADDKIQNVIAAQQLGAHALVYESYEQLEHDITEILGYSV